MTTPPPRRHHTQAVPFGPDFLVNTHGSSGGLPHCPQSSSLPSGHWKLPTTSHRPFVLDGETKKKVEEDIRRPPPTFLRLSTLDSPVLPEVESTPPEVNPCSTVATSLLHLSHRRTNGGGQHLRETFSLHQELHLKVGVVRITRPTMYPDPHHPRRSRTSTQPFDYAGSQAMVVGDIKTPHLLSTFGEQIKPLIITASRTAELHRRETIYQVVVLGGIILVWSWIPTI